MNDHHEDGMDSPNPESRAALGCAGTPVVLSDGATWLLRDGGLCNYLDEIRDRLFDDSRRKGRVERDDVYVVALELLVANYSLNQAEAWILIHGADGTALTEAVFEALFGPDNPRQTYTSWAASSLIANGIDPEKIPTPLRQQVLMQLVAMKRAIPAEDYIDSAVAARRFAGLRALATRQAPPPESPPQSPIVPEPAANGNGEGHTP